MRKNVYSDHVIQDRHCRPRRDAPAAIRDKKFKKTSFRNAPDEPLVGKYPEEESKEYPK
jgi:hypothetical protein